MKGGVVCDGPIFRFACNVINYFCTKFGAFITNAQLLWYASVLLYELVLFCKGDFSDVKCL